MVLNSIGVLSCAKISATLNAIVGLIAGLFFAFFSLLGLAVSPGEASGVFGLLFGVGAVILMPLFYGTIGLITGLLGALFYNLIAKLVGGLELELQ